MYPIETASKTFIDGNGTTELGTILPAWWLNQVQAEILAVLTSAGITADKAKQNQLLDAIKKVALASIPDASSTVPGILKVNNTLISTAAGEALSALQGKILNESKADKSKTLSGYGIEDWKIENITTANSSQASVTGQGVFSFATVTTDAPKWSTGDGIGANKMLQVGVGSWDTQISLQGYGECAFIRSRRIAGGPYQAWKRLDGADWAATEEQVGYIANKPNISKSHLRNGYARLSNGTVLQWGAVTSVNGQANWIYPIAFPNEALQVFASQDGVIGVTYTVGATIDTTNATTLKTQAKVTSTLTTGSDAFFVFAIGY